ncbi:hypothetical protein [Stenotrophomonas maltophilia]|uniref:hypothetical protein n=1 Tax=Stenotrophomonas maltophilia TaxID=40324 RepID=UPI0039C1E68F
MQLAIRSRGMANQLNPLDHPWNFDSAMVAKHRLRCITGADREACNDGKWVPMQRGLDFWDVLITRGEVYLRGRRALDVAEIKRYFKPRYRWERRR